MKMIRLGVVGAENSHSYCIGNICNVENVVPMRVVAIWGETDEFAKVAAEKGSIPKVVRDWRELLGQVDVVMIDHRHPKFHFEPAEFFIRNGVPTFVDKPMTYAVKEAKQLLDLAEAKKVPVTTFSAIPIQSAFQAFKADLEKEGALQALNSTGPVEIESPWGGIFFYGIHQVDAMVELMGTEAESVTVQRCGANALAVVRYSRDRWATINCLAESAAFHWMACTEKKALTHADVRDSNIYLPAARLIQRLVEERKSSFSRERMLAPVAILEAMQASLQSGKTVRVQM